MLKKSFRTSPPVESTGQPPKPLFKFDDMTERLNREFGDYLRGKRVAMVGKGAREEIVQGNYIDSFDVVVRVHWPIPYHGDILPGDRSEDKPGIKWDPPPFVPEKWQPILGKKTNIFYTSIVDASSKWCKLIVDSFVDEGGKFINEIHPGVFTYLPKGKLIEHFPVRQVTPKLYYHLLNTLNSEPYGGTLAIMDIARHEVESIYLSGFPCFISAETPDGITKNKPNRRTVPYNDFRFLRNFVFQNSNRVSVDDYMAYVFSKY